MSDSLPSGSTSDHEPATNSPEEEATATSTTTISSTPEGPSPPPIQIPLYHGLQTLPSLSTGSKTSFPPLIGLPKTSLHLNSLQVVVVGDIHGQLHDVMFLLQDAGFHCEDRFFVFNGDYVDRGAWGLETFLLLLAWKVFLPQRVFLLRGNHESKYCTSVYGFEKEVLAKYGVKDPTMKSGLSPNTKRGIGLLFGPDCTEAFLKKFQLKLIIRSHEGPDARDKRPGPGGMDEGYTIDHVVPSGKLITLFSAPDYPQFQVLF
ncbi:hypothetical protein DKX38_026196 [Salix brachista]|uniref:Serine/threonine-protein phosphatase n=1 Tax=Salix brachista TaxID=2182728 RepID=A0A5N5K3P8_9ROSI|nr:hypothetical protein DKX38_026196 [Salix brachista]